MSERECCVTEVPTTRASGYLAFKGFDDPFMDAWRERFIEAGPR